MKELKLWAVTLTQLFPSEKVKEWFNPKVPGHRGKLITQYNYLKPPKVKEMFIKVQKNPVAIPTLDVEMTPIENRNSGDAIVVLDDVGQIEDSLVEWRLSLNSRLAFRKQCDVKKYLETYPNLTKKDGYKYVRKKLYFFCRI